MTDETKTWLDILDKQYPSRMAHSFTCNLEQLCLFVHDIALPNKYNSKQQQISIPFLIRQPPTSSNQRTKHTIQHKREEKHFNLLNVSI